MGNGKSDPVGAFIDRLKMQKKPTKPISRKKQASPSAKISTEQALKPETPMTFRQKNFCRYVATTKNVPESALRAGFNQDYGAFLMRQPKIKTQIQHLMDKAGLTDEKLCALIFEGATAMLPEKRSKDGTILQKSHPDFYNRKDYIKMAMQSKEHLKPESHDSGGKTININLNLKLADGLKDSGAISDEEYIELEELAHEPIRED